MDGKRMLEQVKGAVGASDHCSEHITPVELREQLRQRAREEQEARLRMP